MIFAAQVIEHLPYERLLDFLRLTATKLKPEGLLIAETVNPHPVNDQGVLARSDTRATDLPRAGRYAVPAERVRVGARVLCDRGRRLRARPSRAAGIRRRRCPRGISAPLDQAGRSGVNVVGFFEGRVRPGRGRAAVRAGRGGAAAGGGARSHRPRVHDRHLRADPAPAGAPVRRARRRALPRQRRQPERRAPGAVRARLGSRPAAQPLLGRALVLGDEPLPEAVPARVRLRGRGVGGERLRRRGGPARDVEAGADLSAAGARAAAARARPRRPRPARGRVRLPVRLRLLQHARAQEPARADRRLHARLPRAGPRAALPEEHQRLARPVRPGARARGGGGAAGHRALRRLPRGRPADRADRALRLLRLPPPQRGLRADDRRGDGVREAGDRDRLQRQPRLHGRRVELPRAVRARDARRGGRAVPCGHRVGRPRPRRGGPADAARGRAAGRGARARAAGQGRRRRASVARAGGGSSSATASRSSTGCCRSGWPARRRAPALRSSSPSGRASPGTPTPAAPPAAGTGRCCGACCGRTRCASASSRRSSSTASRTSSVHATR